MCLGSEPRAAGTASIPRDNAHLEKGRNKAEVGRGLRGSSPSRGLQEGTCRCGKLSHGASPRPRTARAASPGFTSRTGLALNPQGKVPFFPFTPRNSPLPLSKELQHTLTFLFPLVSPEFPFFNTLSPTKFSQEHRPAPEPSHSPGWMRMTGSSRPAPSSKWENKETFPCINFISSVSSGLAASRRVINSTGWMRARAGAPGSQCLP